MRRKQGNKLFSKRNVVSGFIVFVMVTSVIGFMWGGDNGYKSEKYNGKKFILNEKGWSTTINGAEFTFDFFPSDIENIEIGGNNVFRLKNAIEIDMTYDVNDSKSESLALVQYKIGVELAKTNIYLRAGMTNETEYGNQVITCDDATAAVPVIYLRSSNSTKIYSEDNCIIAESGDEMGLMMIKDRILYTFLGIMD